VVLAADRVLAELREIKVPEACDRSKIVDLIKVVRSITQIAPIIFQRQVDKELNAVIFLLRLMCTSILLIPETIG
jgi:hypothetical protein